MQRLARAALSCAVLTASVALTASGLRPARLPAPAPFNVVPRPRSVVPYARAYAWPGSIQIAAATSQERGVAAFLIEFLRAHGVAAAAAGAREHAVVTLRAGAGFDPALGDEGYVLRITSSGVAMRANAGAGLFYALQTLEQMTTTSGGMLFTQMATIRDWPAYRWRGIHLDVARQYFAAGVVERYVDLAARYKLNRFHWHLTDDQAWRVEIEHYPRLTAHRSHYSQGDVRRIVAYAARRYVTIVPEIEMPAHASAAIAAYPELGCGASDTFCPGATSYAFLQSVLREVTDLFPGAYVHIGGDEVAPRYAKAQPRFTQRIEAYLEARGRHVVGWDEILNGGLSPRAVVMAWRSPARAAAAARRGNETIVSGWPLYFDAAQGDPRQEPPASPHMSTLAQVYASDVTPDGLTRAQRERVLGGEAALWTEHMRTTQRLFYMALPRELALAELLWTPRGAKNWNSFLARLPQQLSWLRANGYAFRIPNPAFEISGGLVAYTPAAGKVQAADAWTSAPTVAVTLRVPLSNAIIRYTRDGTDPTPASPRYERPFWVAVKAGAPTLIRTAAFLSNGSSGTISECRILRARHAPGLPRAAQSWSALVSP